MANTVKLKRSAVQGKTPVTTDLQLGELALNTYDGNLFFKKSVSGTDSIVTAVTVDGTQTLTNKTLTSPTVSGNITGDGAFTGYLKSLNSSGDEGGEILLAKAQTNTTLVGTGITIDSYQNKLRFFEQGGTARGAFIDITTTAAGASSEIITNNGTQTLTNKTINGNSNTVILKNSSTLGAEPLTSEIQHGELVLNYTDGKIYFKTHNNEIDYFVTSAGAGVAGDTFKTFAIAGQTSVVAESPNDTLTIVAGGVISILTDATTDTITITTDRSFPFIKSNGVETTIPLRVAESALANSLDSVYLPFVKSNGSSVTTLKLVA